MARAVTDLYTDAMMRSSAPPHQRIDTDLAWTLILALRRLARHGDVPAGLAGLRLDGGGAVSLLPPDRDDALLCFDETGDWRSGAEVTAEAAQIVDLYLDVALACVRRPRTTGHLGQSLDGRIATTNGASTYVTGPEDIDHLHRMRALSDAVVIGAGTLEHDDPQLTTRRVRGDNPVRVVIDPRRRLAASFRVFQEDLAPALLLCESGRVNDGGARHGLAEVVGVPATEGELSPRDIVAILHRRGLFGIFVEGGGDTVSRFLQRRALDRLQIAVAPVIIGSGRPGISLPAIESLAQAARPKARRFDLGQDVLFDCDLRA